MAVDIPYVREIEFDYGVCDQVSPLIRRVIAHNPSAFTYTGTGTYIIGQGQLAVIDPGPLDNAHIEAIFRATAGETISHILITHTHSDHSPAAAPLKARTGAKTYGYGPHGGGRCDGVKIEEDGDSNFVPDVLVHDGDVIRGGNWSIECVFTPGHTSNHMCYALCEEKALFTGDHVMGWSTSVVSPPDGDMKKYMASLRLLLKRDDEVFWPTHGPAIRDPKELLRAFITHREERENQIIAQIKAGRRHISEMVPIIYAAVDKQLHPAAARSVLAHLFYLVEQGRVFTQSTPDLNAEYHLPS